MLDGSQQQKKGVQQVARIKMNAEQAHYPHDASCHMPPSGAGDRSCVKIFTGLICQPAYAAGDCTLCFLL